jgi:hypothetical protein
MPWTVLQTPPAAALPLLLLHLHQLLAAAAPAVACLPAAAQPPPSIPATSAAQASCVCLLALLLQVLLLQQLRLLDCLVRRMYSRCLRHALPGVQQQLRQPVLLPLLVLLLPMQQDTVQTHQRLLQHLLRLC